jgi:outer membrane protein assembly factor BamB
MHRPSGFVPHARAAFRPVTSSAVIALVLALACGRDGNGIGSAPRDSYMVAVRARTGDEIWAARTPNQSPGKPTVVNNQLFIDGAGNYPTYDGALVAFDNTTGAESWRTSSSSFSSWHPPQQAFGIAAPVAGSIAAVSDGGRVRGLDAKKGEERWSAALKADGPPIDTGDLVLVAVDQEIHALDSQTGIERWVSTPATAPRTQRVGHPVANSTSVLLVEQTAESKYKYPENQLVALDLGTGSVRWQAALGSGNITSPLLTDEDVVVATASWGTLVIDSVSGRELWRREIGGSEFILSWVALADQTVYLMSSGPHRPSEPDRPFVPAGSSLEALDARTGARRWVTEDLAGTRDFIAAGDQFVLLGNGGDNPRDYRVTPQNGTGMTVLALDAANGSHIWERTLLQAPELFDTYPTAAIGSIVDGVVYLASTVLTVSHEPPEPE